MELKQKAKTEVYHFEAESQSPSQAPYEVKLVVEDGKFQTCDVSIKVPTNREHWALFALIAQKITQICGSDIPMDEWEVKTLKPQEVLPPPAIEGKHQSQQSYGIEP